MKELGRIRDQLAYTFDGEGWHGFSLMEILTDVDARAAAAKPVVGAHSIWELVQHVTAWETIACRRLKGEVVKATPADDWPPVQDESEEGWQKTLAGLKNANRRLRQALSRLRDADLSKKVSGEKYAVYFMLYGVVHHNLYHAGQIALLKKALASP